MKPNLKQKIQRKYVSFIDSVYRIRKSKRFKNAKKRIYKNKGKILQIYIIILIFWTSSLVTTRTTALYSMREIDIKVKEYVYLADKNFQSEPEVYQTLAKYWWDRSQRFFNFANHRTSGLILCGYSILFVLITMAILLLSNSKWWMLFFCISVIFFLISIPIITRDFGHDVIHESNIFKIVGLRNALHNEDIIELIQSHDWLVQDMI